MFDYWSREDIDRLFFEMWKCMTEQKVSMCDVLMEPNIYWSYLGISNNSVYLCFCACCICLVIYVSFLERGSDWFHICFGRSQSTGYVPSISKKIQFALDRSDISDLFLEVFVLIIGRWSAIHTLILWFLVTDRAWSLLMPFICSVSCLVWYLRGRHPWWRKFDA
jgi:hypothetical protein